jgi:2-keto-4-pentenoate hydratase/2-oxohepta-3-ene-1,7-dioic acid hydratase in catechol pathway
MNYGAFVAAARTAGMAIPPDPIWFYRPRGCLAGAADDVLLPRGAKDFDFECELAIVIGRRCREVTAADAPGVIAGYSIANDLTLRSRVARSLVFAKSFDTHTPLGPWIVTADELGDPHRLGVRTWVNGALRQKGDTSDMLAGCFDLVAEISAVCILNPGDVILTGTPDGCGVFDGGMLAAGDVVRCEIDGLGALENRVAEEAAPDAASAREGPDLSPKWSDQMA